MPSSSCRSKKNRTLEQRGRRDLPAVAKAEHQNQGGTLATLPPDENHFADWSAGLFLVGHTQYILVTNTKSLYSTVLPGKGVTDEATFVGRASSSIREFLEADGYREVYERSIAPLMGTVQFAKTLNRSVTGSVNDLIKQTVILLEAGELSLVGGQFSTE